MSPYSISDIHKSTDHYKLYTLSCERSELFHWTTVLKSQNIPVINIGRELANFISKTGDYKYLNIDAPEFLKHLLEIHRDNADGSFNNVVAIYNLGILLEPDIDLSASHILKEFSKSTGLIIIWENRFDTPEKLAWETQRNTFFFDFSDTPLKILNHEV